MQKAALPFRDSDARVSPHPWYVTAWRRKQVKGLILRSDQGITYNAGVYQKNLINQHQLRCSMSHKGAVAESFFGTLKTELTNHEDYRTRAQAKQSLFEYIEVFYNRQRRHSTLGYLSPAEFERRNAHY